MSNRIAKQENKPSYILGRATCEDCKCKPLIA